jgi:hypothetical protein
MSTQDLQTLLRQLHAELGRADALDPESRRLLDVVVDDIRRVGTADAAPTDTHATPIGLEALAVRFEADHPSMAAALRRLADVLGKAGI